MKTFIVVIHPNIDDSVVNKRWVEELRKFPEKYVIHELHTTYANEKIDVLAEQALIEKYDKIVFQFPFYWFNCPPLLKKWLDEVLIYGWAFGSKSGYKVESKKVALAISLGADQGDYTSSNVFKYSLEELTRSFELTFNYVKADYRPLFAQYGVDHNASPEWVENSVSRYVEFLDSL